MPWQETSSTSIPHQTFKQISWSQGRGLSLSRHNYTLKKIKSTECHPNRIALWKSQNLQTVFHLLDAFTKACGLSGYLARLTYEFQDKLKYFELHCIFLWLRSWIFIVNPKTSAQCQLFTTLRIFYFFTPDPWGAKERKGNRVFFLHPGDVPFRCANKHSAQECCHFAYKFLCLVSL